MKLDPFRLERWLLEKSDIDLGGSNVEKLQFREVTPPLNQDIFMKYGRTCGSDKIRQLISEWYGVEHKNVLITSGE